MEPAGAVQEYTIDGNTAVDDLVFAGLHAELDNRVMDVLGSGDTAEADRQAIMLQQSMKRANAVFDDDDDDEVDYEEPAANPMEEQRQSMHGLDDFPEDGEVAQNVMANKVLELPSHLKPKVATFEPGVSIPFHESLRPLGVVLNEVESLITVQSHTGADILELATQVCDANRAHIGYVLDTMGPTQNPFYVIQRISDNPISAGAVVYAVSSTAEIAAVAEVEEDDVKEDDFETPSTQYIPPPPTTAFSIPPPPPNYPR